MEEGEDNATIPLEVHRPKRAQRRNKSVYTRLRAMVWQVGEWELGVEEVGKNVVT